MSDKTFVDTNVLVYAHDVDAHAKRDAARASLRELWTEGSGVVSPQVLQEFYVTVTRKLATPLPKKTARAIVATYIPWCIDVTPAEIESAFRIEDKATVGFWDALILAAAVKSGSTRLLSEDLNAGQTIEGVLVENPFNRKG
jgi:predicted nucleic acid-binding protein